MEAKKRNNNNNNNNNWESTQSEQEDMMITMDLRRGPWTVDEDLTLINYIATHGEGRWNSLARCAGLKRTGKSCRLRWLNYLRPDVRRGNITLEEQLLILELHSRWGNRWSKIAQYLPGRTDNEIKNYWRTRVQKHAKQLKCDVNSKQFKDTMRYLWMPRLVERIQAAAATSSSGTTTSTVAATGHPTTLPPLHNDLPIMSHALGNSNLTPENSGNSSDSFAAQVSPVSDLADYYNSFPAISQSMNNNNIREDNYSHNDQVGHLDLLTSPYGYSDQFQANVAQNNQWYPGGDIMDNFLNADDMYFIQQQLNNIDV